MGNVIYENHTTKYQFPQKTNAYGCFGKLVTSHVFKISEEKRVLKNPNYAQVRETLKHVKHPHLTTLVIFEISDCLDFAKLVRKPSVSAQVPEAFDFLCPKRQDV